MLLCALHDYSKVLESIFSTNWSLQGPGGNDPCPCLARQPCVIFWRPGRGASSDRRAPPALGASEDGPPPQRQTAWPGFPDGCQGSRGWSAFSRRFLGALYLPMFCSGEDGSLRAMWFGVYDRFMGCLDGFGFLVPVQPRAWRPNMLNRPTLRSQLPTTAVFWCKKRLFAHKLRLRILQGSMNRAT